MPLSRTPGTLTSWNALGHSRPVTGLIYLSSQYHESAFCSDSGKPEIIDFYGRTKVAVDMMDQTCARDTIQRAIGRWTTAVFYGTINSAAINALVIYPPNVHKDQPEEKIKRKNFAQNCI